MTKHVPGAKRCGTTAKAYLETQEVESLEKAASNLRDRLLIRLLFRLGCRVSEALAITIEDIDFIRGTVAIQHLKNRIKSSCPSCGARLSKNHIYCPGCSQKISEAIKEKLEQHRRRILPIDPETLKILKEYIQRGGPVNNTGQLLLFGINRHRAWQIIKECAERTGLPRLVNPDTGKVHGVSPHRLRDAFAVHAIKHNDTGDGLRMLQVHLGHQSFNTTAKYRKVAGDELKNWYNSLWEEKSGK